MLTVRPSSAVGGFMVAAAMQVAAGCALPGYEVGATGGTGGSGANSSALGGMLNSCGGSFGLGSGGDLLGMGGAPLAVTEMVPLPGGYCIDKVEVTWAQYWDWLMRMSPIIDAPTQCQFNQDYDPTLAGSCNVPTSPETDNTPVICVDWCDALAYCSAIGKQLCGAIGGGAAVYDDFNKHTQSQWYNACSAGGQVRFPYGNSYQNAGCNTAEASQGKPVQGNTFTGCQATDAAYDGVLDLSGNVSEWTNSCNANSGASDNCRIRGGSYQDTENQAACDWDLPAARNVLSPVIGFRCCWRP